MTRFTIDEELPASINTEEVNALNNKLNSVRALKADITVNGINIDIALQLESIDPFLSEDFPINTFTKDPSIVNLTIALDHISKIETECLTKLDA